MPCKIHNLKLLIPIGILLLVTNVSFLQSPIIIDHNDTDIHSIPMEWIVSAKSNLHIAYGHTSHGSQLISGMNSLESYFTDGRFDFSSTQMEHHLHLVEGDAYGEGYMELDCGYGGWADETREYLNAFPDCNVIIWSWCGQVNSVDLLNHYFRPMEQLESEYPEVSFVYMTGHLEGLGPNGSVYLANQEIRDYCLDNNKILFDFADIEKYDPDHEVNYQDYYADDQCNYNDPDGGSSNWAEDWLEDNPDEELSLISEYCNSCAHSKSLNCVQKGIAAWHLWARLAGWDDDVSIVEKVSEKTDVHIFPNPVQEKLTINNEGNACKVTISSILGFTLTSFKVDKENQIAIDTKCWPLGYYLLSFSSAEGNINPVLILKQ